MMGIPRVLGEHLPPCRPLGPVASETPLLSPPPPPSPPILILQSYEDNYSPYYSCPPKYRWPREGRYRKVRSAIIKRPPSQPASPRKLFLLAPNPTGCV